MNKQVNLNLIVYISLGVVLILLLVFVIRANQNSKKAINQTKELTESISELSKSQKRLKSKFETVMKLPNKEPEKSMES